MIFDISQRLRAGLPVWPGDTPFAETRTWALGPECPVNVSALTLSTHSGTHADAPLHYDAAGAAIGAVDLSIYLGPCRVLDRRGAPILGAADFADLSDPPPRLLLRTFDVFPHAYWPPAWTTLSPDAISALASKCVRLIGIDGPSLDPQDSKTMPAHHAVRAAGMAILEGLVLDAVTPGDYELIALPLPLSHADASPVRAVLRSLP
jgi:arylformamidase